MTLEEANNSIGCEVSRDCLLRTQSHHPGPYFLIRVASAGIAVISSQDGWHHEVYLGKVELVNIQRPQLVERDFDA